MTGSREYSGANLKSHRRRASGWLVVGLILLMKMEMSMAFFFNKVLDQQEFIQLLNDLPKEKLSDRQIKRVVLEKQQLPEQALEDLHFKSCKWHDIDATFPAV